MATTTIIPVPTILNILNDNSSYDVDENVQGPTRAKKRRLDHLSWEEKIQRKKLKNRVAAQTSRDRKKAKVEQMESALQQLFNKNEAVLEECEKLRQANERLQVENADLQRKLQNAPKCQCQSRSVVYMPESGSTESLLLPKGTGVYTAAALQKDHNAALSLKIMLACLLYQTCLTNWNPRTSTSTPLNNLHKLSSKISPEIWRVLLKRQLIKNQLLVQKIFREKWWGRHQNTWNPVDVKC
ncbi:X-box-binding protein 1 [Euwallacea similis]|uniref:X-box-binding protein 1 n=1 Tax=Euwallacea similis TaxID=1736056 RepID=UPI00344D1543